MASTSEGPDSGVHLRQNKRDFGSFQSSNVQELIELSDDDYVPPSLPVELPSFTERVSFGKNMKNEHFYLDDQCVYLNHGAFGLSLKEALDIKSKWLVHVDTNPLAFMDRELLPLLVYVVREFASFISCSPTDVVLIPNVTYGMNTVLKSLIDAGYLTAASKIIFMNLTYGSTKKLLKHVASVHDLKLEEINVEFPLKDIKDVVKLVSEKIDSVTKLVIIDHIPSNYGVVLPVKEIIEVCHRSNVQVLIDGAHALGMLDINMRDISADYYIGNAHKWFCNPKGCGFLYVDSAHHSLIRPLVVSHGFESGFTAEFLWSGLMDYTSYLSLLTVIKFWRHYKSQNIRQYITSLSREGGEYLVSQWGTGLLSDIDHFCGLMLVQLPAGVLKSVDAISYEDAELIQNEFHHKYRIEIPIKVIQGALYVRMSVHVYNDINDIKELAAAVNKIITNGGLCKEDQQ